MRFRDFWRSAWADNHHGFAFIVGMHVFWVGPLWFALTGWMVHRPAMVAWAVVAAAGWVGAWAVMLTRVRRSRPREIVDLTPTGPMLVPALLMVVGTFGCLYSF